MTDGDSWKLHVNMWDVMAHIMSVIPLYTTTYHQIGLVYHINAVGTGVNVNKVCTETTCM